MSRLFPALLWLSGVVGLSHLAHGGETLPGSGLVSISEERITLRAALGQLAAQSKITVLNNVGDDPELRLNLKRATFWEALDQIATAADAQVDLYQSNGGIALVRRGRDRNAPLKAQVSHTGPFRVALRHLTAHNDFITGTRSSTALFELAWEPSVGVFSMQTQPQNLVMQDARGHPVETPSGSKWITLEASRAFTFDVPLPSLPRAEERIGLLKGAIAIRGPSRLHTFRFPTPASKEPTLAELQAYIADAKKPLQESAGDKQSDCTLQRVTLNPDTWKVRIAITLPPGGPEFESHEPWYALNEVYLESLDGKARLKRVGYSQDGAGDTRKAVIEYNFANPKKGQRGEAKNWTLVFRAPASMVERKVSFEFKDVPLP